jgi:hypothetical protein
LLFQRLVPRHAPSVPGRGIFDFAIRKIRYENSF